jgi:transcriptional regulator with XRE-family HTH domain
MRIKMTTMSYDSRYERLQKALIEARQSAGLTQAEVSSHLNKPQSFVSKYESGERRLDIIELLDICSVINVKIDTVLRKINNDNS